MQLVVFFYRLTALIYVYIYMCVCVCVCVENQFKQHLNESMAIFYVQLSSKTIDDTYILSTDSEISAQKSLTMEFSLCRANSFKRKTKDC